MSQIKQIQQIHSPINQQGNCKLVETISTEVLAQKYQELYQLDISSFIGSLQEIKVYECPYTGYRFFHPFTLAGDGPFYEHLEQYPWYYLPWKWEHKKSLDLLEAGQKVLEVGCGQGSFIAKLQSEGHTATGLELNEHGVAIACEQGLDVRGELIEDHARIAANQYDMVCSFQVLEHIADIQSFIQGKIDCLKVGGKLIVAVPNNDSFIEDAIWNVLNMPPHHMGLWREESLRKLADHFPMKLLEIDYEPLQSRHFHWYRKTRERQLFPSENAFSYKLYSKLGLPGLFEKWINFRSQSIHGHTILAVYQKTES